METSYSEAAMYHISDLKKYLRCPRSYRLDQQSEPVPFNRFVRLDDEVTAIAAKAIGAHDCFVGERNDDPRRSLEAMKSCEWLMKARFEYGGLRVKVPFLHRTDGGWTLYFLYIGLYPRTADMQFYCDTVWVLKNLGIPLNELYVIHLNAEYVREEELDAKKLFTVSRCFYNRNNHPSVTVADAVEAGMTDVARLIARMQAYEKEPISPAVRTIRCSGREKCRHYDKCFPEETALPDNSILTLTGAPGRYQMDREGKHELKDADPDMIEGTAMQYAQIMADRLGGRFADRSALSAWFADVVYPVTFLDFEWECFAIPPYKGMKPFDVLLFEYSLHILHSDGTIDHRVFLSVHDDRRELAEQLIRDVPSGGSVVAYNAEGAEKIRIQQLADLFPDLSEPLLGIRNRMKDLQIPFSSGYVYDVRMRGSWTLKRIMSMMNEPGYQELDIQQGMDAVYQWRHLDRGEEDADRERIIAELKAYCGMDSYAALVVFRWLQSLLGTSQDTEGINPSANR